jgi:pimeloyl-ACP methyl ester carboxylesterase
MGPRTGDFVWALIKMPVLLIHGEKDQRFPLEFARTLKQKFAAGQSELYIAKGVGHSGSSTTAGYQQAVRFFLERYWKKPSVKLDKTVHNYKITSTKFISSNTIF